MQRSGVTLSPGSQKNHYFFLPLTSLDPPQQQPHTTHTHHQLPHAVQSLHSPSSPIVCVKVCWTMSPISLQSMIQRLWLLPIQEDQMVVLFDMRRGGVVLGTRGEATQRAPNTHVHIVVNFWMDCSLSGCHRHNVSTSSHLWIFTCFSAINVTSVWTSGQISI